MSEIKITNEEEEDEEPKKTKPTEDTGDGDKPKTNTLIEDTNLAAKRMEEATTEARQERLAAEESYAKMKLGGVTEAGGTAKPKVETDEEYTEKFMKGEENPFN